MAESKAKITLTSSSTGQSSNSKEGISKHHHHHHHDHHAHFVDSQILDQGDSRIHFLADDLNAHDSRIIVEPLSDQTLNVRLGFLQIRHVYEVRFSIEDDLGEDVLFDPLETMYARIESANPSEDGKGHDIVLTFSAMKEKIMQESVTIKSKNNPSKQRILTLHARVLGKGKGTPSLKKGIHCVRIEWDEESDASDWQGF